MRPEATLPIDAVGRLAIRSPGGVDLFLEARESAVHVEVESLRDLLRLWRDMPGARAGTGALHDAQAFTRLTDLDCELRLRRRSIARLGPKTSPDPLSKLFGVVPARIHWRNLLASVFIRRDR